MFIFFYAAVFGNIRQELGKHTTSEFKKISSSGLTQLSQDPGWCRTVTASLFRSKSVSVGAPLKKNMPVA